MPLAWGGPKRRLWHAAAAVLLAAGAVGPAPASAATSHVWRVGTWNGIAGQFQTIQDAVNHAHPGDWILVAPGDYHESGVPGGSEPAGVLITIPNLHLRGMDRNRVIEDGTRAGAPTCSNSAADQVLGRNGIEVVKANNTWIEN